MMGPWKHEFPDTAKEAPAAGLWEMQLWFDRWLKGVDSGGLHGSVQTPAVSLFVQGSRGHWRTEAAWPPAGTALQTWYPGDTGALSPQVPASAQTDYAYDPTVGMHSLAWDPWTTALDPNLPRDHSADDARSLCFTTAPLTEPLQIMGAPAARLRLLASALPLNVVLKLSAVAANGASTLITTGWLKLDGVAVADEQTTVPVPLRTTAYRLEAGERLRLSVACADFPRIWPTPVPASLRLFHGAQTALTLPVQTVEQLITYARNPANKATYAYGNSTGQIAAAAFATLTKLDVAAVRAVVVVDMPAVVRAVLPDPGDARAMNVHPVAFQVGGPLRTANSTVLGFASLSRSDVAVADRAA
jgi:predicted acyl esterase